MIAKLCAHGADRAQAIERLRRAIDEYHIHGLETTLEFDDMCSTTMPSPQADSIRALSVNTLMPNASRPTAPIDGTR